MPTSIDPSVVLREYKPKTFRASMPAYLYEESTPAHRFFKAIGEVEPRARFVAVAARDFFDERLARAVLDFTNSRRDEWTVNRDVQILEGFKADGYGFDSILLLGPRVHELFVADSKALNDHTVLAVPIFRPEFVGDESPDLMDLVRRRYVSTLDWKRKPSPRAYLRFNNTEAGYRSTGRKPGIETSDRVKEILAELTGASGSFVEVGNYVGDSRRITVDGDEYLIADKSSGKESRLPRQRISRWLDDFLMNRERLNG